MMRNIKDCYNINIEPLKKRVKNGFVYHTGFVRLEIINDLDIRIDLLSGKIEILPRLDFYNIERIKDK